MSPEDLDIVRRGYDAFARGDWDTLHAAVRHRIRGSGADSGAEVNLVLWQVVSVRDGQITRMHDYLSGEEALQAAHG